MATRTEAATSPATWAATLAAYSQEKCNDGPPPSTLHRCVRSDGGSHKRNARDFNIVTLQSRAPTTGASAAAVATPSDGAGGRTSKHLSPQVALDQAASPEEWRAAAVTHIDAARKRQMAKAHHCYDIVTMEPLCGIADAVVTAAGGNQELRGKRISKQDRSAIDAITHLPPPGREAPPLPVVARGRKRHDVAASARPFSIVSHQYRADADAKEAAAASALTNAVAAAALSDRNFNPVTQQFNDARVEEEARVARRNHDFDTVEKVKSHTYKTSRIVKRSEGHAFDIVTNHVYNPEMVLALDRQQAVGLLQRSQLQQQWRHRRDAEEAVRHADADRSLNRISTRRLEESTIGHGYDILADAAGAKEGPSERLATRRPPGGGSTYDTLKASMEVRPPRTTDVIRAEGPRTTHERLFHVPSSDLNNAADTFAGRRQLLLPTLERAAGAPRTAPR